jgi:hypothetical protein
MPPHAHWVRFTKTDGSAVLLNLAHAYRIEAAPEGQQGNIIFFTGGGGPVGVLENLTHTSQKWLAIS